MIVHYLVDVPWDSSLTAVEKMAADCVLPTVLLIELAAMLAVHRLVRRLHERWAPSARRDDNGNNDRAGINYVEPEHEEGQEEDTDSRTATRMATTTRTGPSTRGPRAR
jgi:hypothetical protein